MIRKALTVESIKNLRRLRGEFRLPASRERNTRLLGIFLLILGGFLTWVFLHRLQEATLPVRLWSHHGIRLVETAIYGVVALFTGALTWRRAARWYRFGSGQVQLLTRSGTVIWTEDLVGVASGTISHDNGKNPSMTLKWSNTKRRIEIYPSMAQALKAFEPPAAPPSEPLDLADTVDEAGAAGPEWKCKGCGEINPGNFDECWKCQAFRG